MRLLPHSPLFLSCRAQVETSLTLQAKLVRGPSTALRMTEAAAGDAFPHALVMEGELCEPGGCISVVGDPPSIDKNHFVPVANTVWKFGVCFSRATTRTSMLLKPAFSRNWCNCTSLKPSQ